MGPKYKILSKRLMCYSNSKYLKDISIKVISKESALFSRYTAIIQHLHWFSHLTDTYFSDKVKCFFRYTLVQEYVDTYVDRYIHVSATFNFLYAND